MDYAILRFAKHTAGEVSSVARHNFRVRGGGGNLPSNIDEKLTGMNKMYGFQSAQALTDFVRDEVNPKRTRKDNIVHIEMVLSASPSFFGVDPARGYTPKEMEKILAWYQANIDFLQDKWGENFKGAVLHLDESTPHIHASVIPFLDGKLNAKALMGGPKGLVEHQTHYAAYMKSKGFNLERGQPDSKTKHQTLKQFHKELGKPGHSVPVGEVLAKVIENTALGFFQRPSAIRTAITNAIKAYPKLKRFDVALKYSRATHKGIKQQLTAKHKALVEALELARESKQKADEAEKKLSETHKRNVDLTRENLALKNGVGKQIEERVKDELAKKSQPLLEQIEDLKKSVEWYEKRVEKLTDIIKKKDAKL